MRLQIVRTSECCIVLIPNTRKRTGCNVNFFIIEVLHLYYIQIYGQKSVLTASTNEHDKCSGDR